jgi:hypothetical protein
MARDAFAAALARTAHVFRTERESSKNLGFFDSGRANLIRRNGKKKMQQWLVQIARPGSAVEQPSLVPRSRHPRRSVDR